MFGWTYELRCFYCGVESVGNCRGHSMESKVASKERAAATFIVLKKEEK